MVGVTMFAPPRAVGTAARAGYEAFDVAVRFVRGRSDTSCVTRDRNFGSPVRL